MGGASRHAGVRVLTPSPKLFRMRVVTTPKGANPRRTSELKSGTIRVRVATLGSFGKWMVRRDKLVRNPVDRLTRSRRKGFSWSCTRTEWASASSVESEGKGSGSSPRPSGREQGYTHCILTRSGMRVVQSYYVARRTCEKHHRITVVAP